MSAEGLRYRKLPAGTHGLDRSAVQSDQRRRLRSAMTELTHRRGYQAVRVLDLTRLARVSRPTFYSLYADKEDLLLRTYDDIADRASTMAREAFAGEGSLREHLQSAMRGFARMAAADPETMSMFVLGALGAGSGALKRRERAMAELERAIVIGRRRGAPGAAAMPEQTGAPVPDGAPEQAGAPSDLTVKVILGGTREVTATRLRQGRADELPGLADELAAWADSYPAELPSGLACPSPLPPEPPGEQELGESASAPASRRPKRASGRLPSGRHDLSHEFVVEHQRERILDATAEIVARKGISGLTIPEIARRASISHQTFYALFPTKGDAFLGAQEMGLQYALRVSAEASAAAADDWPQAVAVQLQALIALICAEPAYAHLGVVDSLGSSPEAIAACSVALSAFAERLRPGRELAPPGMVVPEIAAEATVGGIWGVLHHYIQTRRIADLPAAAPQLSYLALTPFMGAARAAELARSRAPQIS
jgi:AcrR family transcriptional regulator